MVRGKGQCQRCCRQSKLRCAGLSLGGDQFREGAAYGIIKFSEPGAGGPCKWPSNGLVAAITNRQSPPDKLRRPYLGSRPIIQKAICPRPFAKQTRRRNPFSPHPRACFSGLGLALAGNAAIGRHRLACDPPSNREAEVVGCYRCLLRPWLNRDDPWISELENRQCESTRTAPTPSKASSSWPPRRCSQERQIIVRLSLLETPSRKGQCVSATQLG
jgi:hypothetical protein